MRVIHQPDGADAVVLASDVDIADSRWQRFRGLMLRRPLSTREAMVFRFDRPRSRPVHTMFVRSSIDVVWVESERVTAVNTLSPWTLHETAQADTIVELPAGGAAEISPGDHIRLAH